MAAAVVVVATFAAAALSIENRRQLGTMGAFQSTWLELGLNLAAQGVFGDGEEPTVYKPPGYPLFIAAAVRGLAGKPAACPTCDTGLHWGRLAYRRRVLERSARALAWAQAAALALAAGALCLCLTRVTSVAAAVWGGMLLGADPVLLVLAGSTHYTVLHLFFVTTGCAVLMKCIPEAPGRARGAVWWALAGVWWGLATLVRPVTLLLPVFAGAAALAVAKDRSRAAAGVGCFVVGMAVALFPQGVRNHRLTGEWIPVNAQLWTALFGSTVAETSPSPDRLRWRDVLPQARAVASVAVGREVAGVYEPLSVRENLLLERGYRAAAIANLRAHPGTYLKNVAQSLWSYHVHTTAAYLSVFRHYQQPDSTWPRWGTPGTAADPATWPGGALYRVFGGLLTCLAFAGVGLAVWRRDVRLLGPAAVHVCLAAAHSLTWMDFSYLYLRLPFNCLFAAYLVGAGLEARAGSAVRLVSLVAAAAGVTLLGLSLFETFSA